MPIPPGSAAFPGTLDSFVAAAAGDARNDPSLSAFVTQLGNAIEALEAKVGVDNSGVTTSLDYLVSHSTGTTWTSITGKPSTFPPAIHGLLDAGVHSGIPGNGFDPSIHDATRHNFIGAALQKGANQPTASGNDELITWASTFYNQGGYADLANDRITIVTAGYFRVEARVAYDANANGRRSTRLEKNGINVDSDNRAAANAGATMLQVFWEGHCAANDHFKLFALQNSGGNLSVLADPCAFFVRFLGV